MFCPPCLNDLAGFILKKEEKKDSTILLLLSIKHFIRGALTLHCKYLVDIIDVASGIYFFLP